MLNNGLVLSYLFLELVTFLAGLTDILLKYDLALLEFFFEQHVEDLDILIIHRHLQFGPFHRSHTLYFLKQIIPSDALIFIICILDLTVNWIKYLRLFAKLFSEIRVQCSLFLYDFVNFFLGYALLGKLLFFLLS